MSNNFEQRRARMFKLLKEAGVEVAVFGEPLTFYYLTGVMIRPNERFLGLVMDAEKEKVLAIVPSPDSDAMIGTNIDSLTIKDHELPHVILKETLKNRRIGIQMSGGFVETYSMALSKSFFLEFGMDIVDVSNLAAGMRLIKDEEELDNLKQAALITDICLEKIQKTIKPGLTEKEIMMALYVEYNEMDARSDFMPLILAGAKSAIPHGVPDGSIIKANEPLLIDTGARYKHYWADITRTFFMGEPSQKFREIYNIVLEAEETAIAACKPGVPLGLIDKTARDIITKAGYGEYFFTRVGHGLGLNVHESPSVHGENKDIIEEGMVFTVEPGIYIHGTGGVRIEDDVYITKEGPKIMSRLPKDIDSMILG